MRVVVVGLAWLSTGCTVSGGMGYGAALVTAPSHIVNVRADILVAPPPTRALVGARIEHGFVVDPNNAYDHTRFELLGGYGLEPTPWSNPVGFEALARAGVVRGWIGAPVDIAFTGGATLQLPIRLTKRRERWHSDEMIQLDVLLVPYIDGGVTTPVANSLQVDVATGANIRVALGTAVIP